jgi:hypothetical protein
VARQQRLGEGTEFIASDQAGGREQGIRGAQHADGLAEAAGDVGGAHFGALQELGVGAFVVRLAHVQHQDGGQGQPRQQCEDCGRSRWPRALAAGTRIPGLHAPC